MERIQKFIKENPKIALGGAGFAIGIGLYYAHKTSIASQLRALGARDAHFTSPNLPLYHEEAKLRDKILSNVNYDLVLNFHPLKKEETHVFLGRAKIHFNLSSTGTRKEVQEGLFLDFHGESIKELSINGVEVPLDKISFSKHRIQIGEMG